MKNHLYIFNNELRIQKEGGLIGIDLTGELAQIFMSWWDNTDTENTLFELELNAV